MLFNYVMFKSANIHHLMTFLSHASCSEFVKKTYQENVTRCKIAWKRSPLTISLDIRPMDYMTWILVKYFIFSRTKIFLNEHLQDNISCSKKVLEMLYHCYLRYQMWKNFPNENGEIISIYINESYIGIDYLRWWSVPR